MASAMRSTGGTSTTAAHPRIFARRRTVVSTAVTGVEACSMIMACLGGVCPAFPLREEADDRLGLQETCKICRQVEAVVGSEGRLGRRQHGAAIAQRRDEGRASLRQRADFDLCIRPGDQNEIGRASCRERGCQYVTIPVVAGP